MLERGMIQLRGFKNVSQEGKIVIRPVKGGVMLYLPEEAPASRDSADEALKKMGL